MNAARPRFLLAKLACVKSCLSDYRDFTAWVHVTSVICLELEYLLEVMKHQPTYVTFQLIDPNKSMSTPPKIQNQLYSNTVFAEPVS